MGTVNNSGGQRPNHNDSGRKSRSETNHPQQGSRVEPSHAADQIRKDRETREPKTQKPSGDEDAKTT